MLKKVQVQDIAFQVYDRGSGPALLFVHGFPLDHTMWSGQLEAFPECRVIAPDLRGFGGTDPTGDSASMQRYADDLANLLDALDVGGRVCLCGLSMGGYVAWQFWRRHASRLAGLILCDTRAGVDSPQAAEDRRRNAQRVLTEGLGFLADLMMPRLFAADAQPEIVAATRAVIERTPGRGAAAGLLAMADRSDFVPLLPEVRIPSLVVCGERDVLTPAEEMRTMASAMPDARFVEVPSAGHMAPLESPGMVNAAIREFIRGLHRV